MDNLQDKLFFAASNWSLEKLDLSWNNFNGNQAQRLLIGIKVHIEAFRI